MKSLFFILLFFYSFTLQAKVTKLWCSHVQVCNLAKELLEESNLSSIEVELAIDQKGDPHHFEPTSKDVKKLLSTEYLIVGPMELHPWIAKVLKTRDKSKTIQLMTHSKVEEIYQTNDREMLSHFWLYPYNLCALKEQLAKELKKWNLPVVNPKTCQQAKLIIHKRRLENTFKKYPIIITHNALEAFFKSWGAEVFSLQSSGHHHEVSAKALKQLDQLLKKHKKVIWIFEGQVHIPSKIKKMTRSQDFIIKGFTQGFKGQAPLDTLDYLLQDIEQKAVHE